MEEENFLSIDGFAKKINVHPNTVRRAIKRGKLQAINVGTAKKALYRIPYSEIHRIALFDLRDLIRSLVDHEMNKESSEDQNE